MKVAAAYRFSNLRVRAPTRLFRNYERAAFGDPSAFW